MISYDRYISTAIPGRYHTRRLQCHKLFYDMQILTRKSCRKKGGAKVNDAQIW